MKPAVDQEFMALIPPLTEEERSQLEANILADGCLDPLRVWSTGRILLDGHNRFAICERHGIEYDITEIDLPDRERALLWIEEHQLGRRNLSIDQRAAIAFRVMQRRSDLARRERAKAGGHAKHGTACLPDTSTGKQAPIGKAGTRAAVATEYKVPERKLRSMQVIASVAPEAVEKIARGEITLKDAKRDIKEHNLAKERDRIAAQVKAGPTPPTVVIGDGFEWIDYQPECDLLLTDPPYMTDVDDICSFAPRVMSMLETVKPTGRAYICIGAYPSELQAYLNAPVPEHMALEQVLVWSYRNTLGPHPTRLYKANWQAILYFVGVDAPALDCPIMNEQFSAQEINAPDGRQGNRYHAWQKPDELAERIIRHATKPGNLVLDPFACTGTFVLAANRLGRIGRGCEINAEFAAVAFNRGAVRG